MNWVTGLQRSLDYIEDHICDDIDCETLAERCYSSSYHFQRVFGLLCGYTVGEYIRNRRLSLAGAELASGTIKVIDAALKYGYESPDSFAKAFRRFHGVLPSQAISGCCNLRSFSPLVLKISLEGGRTMDYRIEEKGELVFTGYKRRFEGVPGERADQEKDMYISTRPLQYILSGLSGHSDSEYNIITNVGVDGYDFYIAHLLPDWCRDKLDRNYVLGAEAASYFEQIRVGAQKYAVFETERCRFPTMVYLDLRRRIAEEWLPWSGYRLADAPEIVVTYWYDGDMKDERYRELWIPIEKDE